MSTIRISDAASEPLTLAQIKAYTRIDVSDDDALCTDLLIPAARQHAETIMRRSILPTQWRLALDAFPCKPIRLNFPQLISVESVKYFDAEGVEITMPSADYIIDTVGSPGCIACAPHKTWPATQARINAVNVDYTSGWPSADLVPQDVKLWIAQRVAYAYDNRSLILAGASLQNLPFVDGLLARYKVWEL